MEETAQDNVAEWSKAVDSGSIPKGRGFEPLRYHFSFEFTSLK